MHNYKTNSYNLIKTRLKKVSYICERKTGEGARIFLYLEDNNICMKHENKRNVFNITEVSELGLCDLLDEVLMI